MTTPCVSVIIPVYNAERYLAQSVTSALEQDWPSIDLILIDDGSTDGSLRIAESFTSDTRVRFLPGDNGGPARARNLGVRASRGELVAFLDADDLWLPGKLKRQIPWFEEASDTDVVYSQRIMIDSSGGVLEGYRPPIFSGRVLRELWVDNFVCMSSAVVRRSLFDRIGYFDENLRMSEDFDFWLRAAVTGMFKGIEEPLVQYRVHGEQTSRRIDERVQVAWEIRSRFEEQYGGLLSAADRRRAKARHFATRGYREEAKGARLQSLSSYLRALRLEPTNKMALKGVVKAILPGRISDLFRKDGGKPFRAGAS